MKFTSIILSLAAVLAIANGHRAPGKTLAKAKAASKAASKAPKPLTQKDKKFHKEVLKQLHRIREQRAIREKKLGKAKKFTDLINKKKI